MSEKEFEIFGSVYNGCEVNLIRFCGLELTDEQLNTLWANTTEYHLLIAAGADLEEDTFDEGMSGQSDIGYTTVVTDSFKNHLKEVILDIINESWFPEVEKSFFYSPRLVESSIENVVDSYRNAAEQGHTEAQFNLGIAYETGDGVPKDHVEAVKWFRKSAEQTYAPDIAFSDTRTKRVKALLKTNPRKPSNCIVRLLSKVTPKHRKCLVLCTPRIRGPKDYVDPMKWSRKAAEQGLMSAQLKICATFTAAAITSA